MEESQAEIWSRGEIRVALRSNGKQCWRTVSSYSKLSFFLGSTPCVRYCFPKCIFLLFLHIQTWHHPASLTDSCGCEMELCQQNVNGCDVGHSHAFFFIPFSLLAGCDGNLESDFGSYIFKMAEVLPAWIPEWLWSRTPHHNTHFICHLPGLLHNDAIKIFVEPFQICSYLLSQCSLN